MKRLSLAAALVLALLAGGRAAAEDPFTLPLGTYRAALPENWDGKSPLPLVLFMHGYGQNSAYVMEQRDFVVAATGLGALFVVPDGIRSGWAFTGSPMQDRDDKAFLHAVVADAERRWPVDRARVLAAGFSIGASMVWELACHSAQGFAAFLPISGDFWLPYPARCESGPVTLRHVHGMDDHTVPMGGRPLRGGLYTQGDLAKSWEILRAADGCAAEPDSKPVEGRLSCMLWTSCTGRHPIEMCFHGDGHEMNPDFLRSGLAWAFGVIHR